MENDQFGKLFEEEDKTETKLKEQQEEIGKKTIIETDKKIIKKPVQQKKKQPNKKKTNIHVFNRKNLINFFILKPAGLRPYEIYFFFLNDDINLSNKIDEESKKLLEEKIIIRDKNYRFCLNKSNKK